MKLEKITKKEADLLVRDRKAIYHLNERVMVKDNRIYLYDKIKKHYFDYDFKRSRE